MVFIWDGTRDLRQPTVSNWKHSRAIRGELEPHASIAEGVRAQANAEAAVQSVMAGQPVQVPHGGGLTNSTPGRA